MSAAKPNWLLRGLIAVSIAVHSVALVHISGLYRSEAITYIELTVDNILKPGTRAIPRPRHRVKDPPRPMNFTRPKVQTQPVPALKPLRLEPAGREIPDTLVENVGIPDVPSAPACDISKWEPAGTDINASEYGSANSYLELVKLRIEEKKRYPESARSRQTQGQVVVRFVITEQGNVEEAEIVRNSRSSDLDRAALDAVRSAAPFPRPPRQFFKGDITLEIRIVFELT